LESNNPSLHQTQGGSVSLYGGMSKGERNRIKVRVRSAMAAQAATEGRFLGGRPPYGYRLVDAGPHPNPGKAANGQQLRRLDLDPATAPVVERIFAEWLAGAGLHRIAEGLTRDGILSPSAQDPARNRHRTAGHGAWGKSAVRAILANPRYTGYEVWNKQRRDEVLLDVNDVAAGYETKLRWNDPDTWVWSAVPAHPTIVDLDTWKQAQRHLDLGRAHSATRRDKPTPRPYVLRGLVRCGLCGRKMQGTWNNGRPHYRCQFAAEYAAVKEIDHPKTVYLREDVITSKLDGWINKVFDPDNIEATCAALADAGRDTQLAARAEAARAKIADCDRRLANYRKTLDLGGPPATLIKWMAEVDAERVAAERELGATVPREPFTASQLRIIVDHLKDTLRMLAEADATTKAALYAGLGITLTYHPDRQVVSVEADLSHVDKSVSEGVSEFNRSWTRVARHAGHHYEGVCAWISPSSCSTRCWSSTAVSGKWPPITASRSRGCMSCWPATASTATPA
jgi:site-specific DNA recombinase